MRFRFPFFILLALTAATLFLRAEPSDDEIAQKFQQFDTNHDGVLSGDELNAAPFLRQLDLNGDGKVTLEEAREAVSRLRAVGATIREKVNPGVVDAGTSTESLFKRFDKNGDGKLTPDELPYKRMFERLDLNKDGVVTLEEARQVLGDTITRRSLEGTLPKPASFKESDIAPLQEQPLTLKPGARGIGRRIDQLTLPDLAGRQVPIRLAAGGKAVVLALFGATCPISNKLAPELARIENDFGSKNVAFYFVNIAPETKPAEVRKFVADFGWKSAVLNDPSQALQRMLAATTSTEVFVLDAARTLVYRGAVNDQYGLGYSKEAVSKNYLRDALDAVLKAEPPAIAATSAPGCALDVPASPARTALTYYHDVSRILQGNCVLCHRSGGIAPFPLDTYDDVIEHAGMIRKQVTRGAMPPWFAAETPGHEHVWANDRSLSAAERSDLLAWLNSDRPTGRASDAPVALHFDNQWMIGPPDAVFQLPQPVQIKAEGTMPYQNAVVETNLTEDHWVRGYEIQPTNRAVVHHVIVRVHAKGASLAPSGDGLDGFFAAYVPGNTYRVLPDGFAKFLPAGSRISFQIHYTPNGHATQDQMKIGLLFASGPPQHEVHVSGVAKPRILIPPGEANHVETKEIVIPTNMMVMGLMPHMHVRGKAFKYELTPPGGQTETLLDIPHYDFNWQIHYEYATPKFVPAGSKLKITAIYDNSAGNAANPDPTKTVRWGEQTFDEMMVGYVEHFTPYGGGKVASQ